MSTITRERIEQLANGNNICKVTREERIELARIALASLEAEPVCVIDQTNLDYLKSGADADVWPASRAEMGDVLLYRAALPAPANADPVAWMWSHRKHPSEVTLVRPEDDEQAEGAHWSGWSCQALYAAPPAPVSVHESEPVAYIFKHPAGRLFWSLTDESNKGQRDVMPVYSAPVPAFVPPVIEPDYEVIKGILPTANPDEYACCIDGAHWVESRVYTAPPAPEVK